MAFGDRLNKSKRWREYEAHGRIAYKSKKAPRDWFTLYQHSGVALQVNPTYYEFRLWVFTQYGNVGVDLSLSKITEIQKALGLSRLLISNVPSTVNPWSCPVTQRPLVRMTEGERRYASRQVNKLFVRKRKGKVNITQVEP